MTKSFQQPTLQRLKHLRRTEPHPSAAEAALHLRQFTARLKPCPFTVRAWDRRASGAKAQRFEAFSARVNSCPVTRATNNSAPGLLQKPGVIVRWTDLLQEPRIIVRRAALLQKPGIILRRTALLQKPGVIVRRASRHHIKPWARSKRAAPVGARHRAWRWPGRRAPTAARDARPPSPAPGGASSDTCRGCDGSQ